VKTSLDKQAREMLKAAKLYCTQHRITILKTLLATKRPLSQEQIAQRCGRKRFNKVTIYRTIDSLLKVGLIHKAFIEKRASHYELVRNRTDKQCHPHFTCTSCGNTHCLTDIILPMASSPHNGFVIKLQKVHLEGLCPKCA
jgi:Fur family ferric uptake transcriptional regulator